MDHDRWALSLSHCPVATDTDHEPSRTRLNTSTRRRFFALIVSLSIQPVYPTGGT